MQYLAEVFLLLFSVPQKKRTFALCFHKYLFCLFRCVFSLKNTNEAFLFIL